MPQQGGVEVRDSMLTYLEPHGLPSGRLLGLGHVVNICGIQKEWDIAFGRNLHVEPERQVR